MNKKTTIGVIVLILISIPAYVLLIKKDGITVPMRESVATTTSNTTSTDFITFTTPTDFRLALDKSQITVSSYIPPCREGFDYCLYYTGENYAGSNFESAGIAIQKRDDLKKVKECLHTNPEGYTNMKSVVVVSTTVYTLAKFSPVGDAGAGHYASGEIYRLAYDGSCHEFETRVGASQYANFPEGSIKEFTNANRDEINAKMMDILSGIVLSSGDIVSFRK
jgi:hypothetical protein